MFIDFIDKMKEQIKNVNLLFQKKNTI